MSDQHSWQKVAADLQRVKTPKGRNIVGCFSIEGTVLHERAIKAGATIEQVLISQAYLDRPTSRIQRLIQQIRENAHQVQIVPDKVLATLTNQRSFGAILGLVTMPRAQTLAQLALTHADHPLIFLCCVDVEDAGNLGSLVRTAHASGASALITVGKGDPFHPKSVRTSMGSIFKLPILHYRSIDALMAALRQYKVNTIGTVVHNGIPLPDAALSQQPRLAIFMGSELLGLSSDVVEKMDQRISIPMTDGIDSFSVNAAAAITLYEAQRGR